MGSRRSATNVPPSSRLCRRPRSFVTVDLLSGQRRVRVLDWSTSSSDRTTGRCGPERHPITGRRALESWGRLWTLCCQPRGGMRPLPTSASTKLVSHRRRHLQLLGQHTRPPNRQAQHAWSTANSEIRPHCAFLNGPQPDAQRDGRGERRFVHHRWREGHRSGAGAGLGLSARQAHARALGGPSARASRAYRVRDWEATCARSVPRGRRSLVGRVCGTNRPVLLPRHPPQRHPRASSNRPRRTRSLSRRTCCASCFGCLLSRPTRGQYRRRRRARAGAPRRTRERATRSVRRSRTPHRVVLPPAVESPLCRATSKC